MTDAIKADKHYAIRRANYTMKTTTYNKIVKCFTKRSFSNAKETIGENWNWIVIKPVLILYCFQYAITLSITSQVR